jgi:hypothetical protein
VVGTRLLSQKCFAYAENRWLQQLACAVAGAAAGVDLAVQCLPPDAQTSRTSRFYANNPTIDNYRYRR